jgi:UPF0755 protein
MAKQKRKPGEAAGFIARADGLLQGVSRQARVFAVSLCVVLVLVFGLWATINNRYLAPVHKGDLTAINIEIPRGSSVATIAKILEENGVIRSSVVFRLFVDIYDRGSKLKAGSYEFNASMTVMDVLDKISVGETSTNVVKIFLPEGGTIADLANSLENLGLIQDKNAFIQNMQDPTPFVAYSFLEEAAVSKDDRIVAMEGYLFPDTYQVFTNASEDEIVRKFLTRFNGIFTTAYTQRAEVLGMSIDEVITLASLIQREGKDKDFAKISAVFHNRLSRGMRMDSDVTVQYVLGIKRLNLTTQEIEVDSPYNTYKHTGLPPGPICNPGKAAIEAALWPDEAYVEQGMLYFCLTDPETGDLVFAKTLSEHNKNVQKYRPLWQKHDQEQ